MNELFPTPIHAKEGAASEDLSGHIGFDFALDGLALMDAGSAEDLSSF